MGIGCHGMRHRPWRGLGETALHEEHVEAKAMLEQVVERPVTEAACPFGSYDRRVLRSLRGSGYRRVYTSDRGTTGPEDFLQARNTIGPDDRPELLGEIASVAENSGPAGEDGGEAMAVTAPTKRRTEVRPIADDDVGAVAEFLHEHLNQRISTGAWARSMEVPWDDDRPNAGFMLLAGGKVVGVHLAFYSERTIEGRTARFCNLGAWCVLEQYRINGLRLLTSLLAQDGYHFTDLSPSGNVIGLNKRLGFQFLDTTTKLILNLPWPSVPGHAGSSPTRSRSAPGSAVPSSRSIVTTPTQSPRGTWSWSGAIGTAM